MGRIHVLDDRLINRIAAGEVVERPASVVKELVENSLDAGASSIEVELAGGGRRLIRVVDDGCGMDRDDALLAVERHATSKLGIAADLEAIATLGFRGEALSSIAAVSEFVLRTAQENGAGTEIVVSGGTIRHAGEVGWPRGTSVEVSRLFFNVPARRKFLRTSGTELGHVVRWLTRYALAHPRIRFRLQQEGRVLLGASPVEDPRERIAEIYGGEAAERLLPFRRAVGPVSVHGLAGRPVDALPRRDGQHLFVNGRAVQDRLLTHAASEAYGNTMPRGRFPSLFLFVELDPSDVDVNVHPQKIEVRFRRPTEVHDLVRDAIAGGLSHTSSVPEYGDLRRSPDDHRQAVAQATARYMEREPANSTRGWIAGPPPAGTEPPVEVAIGVPGVEPSPEGWEPAATLPAEPTAMALAQYRESYIVAQDREGLLLVDQHAAHERVIFERYLEQAESNTVERQSLLFPVTVELSTEEAIVAQEELPELRRLGLDLEPFGERTMRVDAVPALAGEVDAAVLLKELIGEAAQTRSAASGVGALRHRLVTSAACQAAIKVNYPLTRPAMQGLLDDLFATVNPTTCPHGRPALFRLTLDEIERAFHRR